MTQMIGPTTDLYRYLADPAAKERLVKLKFRTRLQEGLAFVAVILLACSILGIVCGTYGLYPSRRSLFPPNYDPDPGLVRYSTGALVISLILLAARFCSWNCYLFNPARGCLIWQCQFLWFRRMRVVLERSEIAGVEMDPRIRTSS